MRKLAGLFAAVALLGLPTMSAAKAAGPAPTGVPAAAPAAAHKPEPALPKPAGWPFAEAFPRTSGTGRLAGGASYWSDFLYDDHGAKGTSTSFGPVGLAPSIGTYLYASPNAHQNGADIFRTAIGADDTNTYWRVDWNTLTDPTLPIAEFAIDVDGNPKTGTTDWPAGAAVHSPGTELALVVTGTKAWLVDAATGVRRDVSTIAGQLAVDGNAQSFVVRVPKAALPSTAKPWTVRLAAGVNDGAGNFAPVSAIDGANSGQPPVYNVAFRSYRQETPGNGNYWMDGAQANALAAGDVTPFSITVNWAQLASKTTQPEPRPTGYTNRWYVSSIQDLGPGVIGPDNNAGFDDRPNYLGRVQPYAVYVPSSYTGKSPVPLTWILHSLSEQHNQYGTLAPKLLQAFCEKRNSICATTLGRGPDGWYYDEAEVDFWEVWNRLASTYSLDPERTVLSGYSMGGWGTYKLGLAYPSLFAKAMALAGPPACGIRLAPGFDLHANNGRCTTEGNTTPLVENARWLPFVIHQGVADELVPVASVILQSQQFDKLGYRYRLQLYPTGDHLASSVVDPIYLGDEAAQIGNDTRKQNPGHITYTWYPHLARPEWGIGPNGAWWVQDVAAADAGPGKLAHIDATSGARPEPAITSTTQQGLDPQAAASAFTERTWHEGATPPRITQLQLTLTNVGALTLDLAGAGFRPAETGTVAVTSDRSTRLVLKGLADSMGVAVDGGAPGRVVAGAGAIALAAGAHQVTFAPLPSPPSAAGPGTSVLGSQLPATGAPETALAGAGIALLVGALALRRVLARAVLRR